LPHRRSISSAIAFSQGQRSSSVNGWPALILATLLAGGNLSPSSQRQPSRPESASAIVVLPAPETPITISAQGFSDCPMSAKLSPAAAVARQQFVGLRRTLGAGLVGFKTLGAGALPGVDEGLHRLPAGLDAVGALEQNVVADHAVIDQRLIAG